MSQEADAQLGSLLSFALSVSPKDMEVRPNDAALEHRSAWPDHALQGEN